MPAGTLGLSRRSPLALHSDRAGLGEAAMLEDVDLREEGGELLESFIGERSRTAQDGAKTGEAGLPGLGTVPERDRPD